MSKKVVQDLHLIMVAQGKQYLFKFEKADEDITHGCVGGFVIPGKDQLKRSSPSRVQEPPPPIHRRHACAGKLEEVAP